MSSNQPLKDKVAIVTGAGKGVGSAAAQLLGRAGARIAVNDINPDRAERVAEAIRQKGGTAIAVGADVANKFQCVHLIETTRAEWGQLDILVNHAAVSPTATLLKLDEWDWQRCLDVTLKGSFFMCQLVGRVMADENRTRGGRIINISGPAGVVTAGDRSAALSAAQAGIVGFTRTCAREFSSMGVTVNVILPVKSKKEWPSTSNQGMADEWPPPLRGRVESFIQVGDDLNQKSAAVIAALCIPESAGLTGLVLPVDGEEIMG